VEAALLICREKECASSVGGWNLLSIRKHRIGMKDPGARRSPTTAGQSTVCAAASGPWVLAATILGSSMAFIDSTIVNVALPALQSTLHATVVDVQWVIESYGLFLSALILVGGALGDSVGRRAMFLLGVAGFALASVGCGFSSSIGTLLIWRSVQGIAAAALVPGSLAIIGACFDEQSRGKAIGSWAGFTTITTALGPVLGGWLIEHVSWHWIFFINLPIAALALVITFWRVPESRNPEARSVDWLGGSIATFGLAALVYGFLSWSIPGWSHFRVIASLIFGAGALILFLLVESKVKAPMVPLRLFKVSTFSSANLLTLFLYAALGTFFFVFPLNLIQIQKYSATSTGAAALPMILLMFLLSRWSGGLVNRHGPKVPLVIGPLFAAAGFLLFAVPSVHAQYWSAFFPAFLVLGLGMAITVAPLTTVVMNSVGQERAGAASGINNAVARVAGVLAVAVLGALMTAAFAHTLRHSVAALKLNPEVVHRLEANLAMLGDLDVPQGTEETTALAIRSRIADAFVFGFRLITVLCAGLATASALVAWWKMPSETSARTPDPGSQLRLH
jgi:EmrB/QacA subfamily drug resistance transporter